MKITNTLKITRLLAILLISFLTFTACSDDDDHDHDEGTEEELITTVRYTLTNGNNIVTLTFSDPDGEGGNDGTYSISGDLDENLTYTGLIELLNETYPSNVLINGYIIDKNITDEEKINMIKKRVSSFFDDKNFIFPAINSSDVIDTDYSNSEIWNAVKSNPKALGFYYLIGDELGCKLAYSKKHTFYILILFFSRKR